MKSEKKFGQYPTVAKQAMLFDCFLGALILLSGICGVIAMRQQFCDGILYGILSLASLIGAFLCDSAINLFWQRRGALLTRFWDELHAKTNEGVVRDIALMRIHDLKEAKTITQLLVALGFGVSLLVFLFGNEHTLQVSLGFTFIVLSIRGFLHIAAELYEWHKKEIIA